MSENKKTYINGVWAREKTFNDGGSIIKLSISSAKFLESIKNIKPDEKGFIKLVISKKKTPDDTSSHSIYIDDWKPSGQNQAPITTAPANSKVNTGNSDF